MTYSRRDLAALIGAALPSMPVSAKPNSVINGVIIGTQSYSLRDRSLDDAIEAMVKLGIGYCELGNNHMEPKGVSREELRKWRETVSLSEFKSARRKFDKAGVKLTAYTYPMRSDLSDTELRRGFEMAKALGVDTMTTSSQVSMSPRIDEQAKKFKIRVAMHNHSRIAPDEFARPEDFLEAMKGRSSYIGVNLDTGHFTAAGFDPAEFTRNHFERIFAIHIKDRKKNQGANVPFGEGDTPNKEILQFVRDRKLKIPVMIEYEYKYPDTMVEMKRCMDWVRSALA